MKTLVGFFLKTSRLPVQTKLFLLASGLIATASLAELFVECRNRNWPAKDSSMVMLTASDSLKSCNRMPAHWKSLLDSNQQTNHAEPAGLFSQRICSQISRWKTNIETAVADLDTSETRLKLISRQLTDASNQALFAAARKNYEEEHLVNAGLKRTLERLCIKTVKDDFPGSVLVSVGLLILCFLSSIILSRMASTHITAPIHLENWKPTYALFAIFIAGSMLSVSVYTNLITAEKSWIGPSSFAVSPAAWCCECLWVIGLAMLMSVPSMQLWCYTSERYIPTVTEEHLLAPSQSLELNSYVGFLQLFTLLIFTAFCIVNVVSIRWVRSAGAQFDPAYLGLTFSGALYVGSFVVRMVWNAIRLRLRYQLVLCVTFPNWSEFKKDEVAPDPTVDFIGESWWKLPLNFVGIVSASWAVLEWTGVAKYLTEALK